MDLFNNLLNNLMMLDLPMGNQYFTWTNMQNSPTIAKLDRFLISTVWDQEFPLTKVVALPRATSDHFPILLSTGDKLQFRMFRMEEVWLTRQDFYELVPVWWKEQPCKENSALTFAAKLRHCRKRINEWCKTSFYNIGDAKKTISDEIQQLDLQEEQTDLTTLQLERRKQLRSQLKGLVMEEELLWKTGRGNTG